MNAGRVAGFTLIEALVAIVVISIGLLGLLALQTTAVVTTDNAQYASLAQIAIDDMADRIRANPAASARGLYGAASPADGATAAATSMCNSAQNACAPPAVALLDRREWQGVVKSNLPAGKGFVDCAVSAQPCPVFTITVGWAQRADSTSAPPAGLSLCDSNAHASAIVGPCLVGEVRP